MFDVCVPQCNCSKLDATWRREVCPGDCATLFDRGERRSVGGDSFQKLSSHSRKDCPETKHPELVRSSRRRNNSLLQMTAVTKRMERIVRSPAKQDDRLAIRNRNVAKESAQRPRLLDTQQ